MLVGLLEQQKFHGQMDLGKSGLNKANKCLYQRPSQCFMYNMSIVTLWGGFVACSISSVIIAVHRTYFGKCYFRVIEKLIVQFWYNC